MFNYFMFGKNSPNVTQYRCKYCLIRHIINIYGYQMLYSGLVFAKARNLILVFRLRIGGIDDYEI